MKPKATNQTTIYYNELNYGKIGSSYSLEVATTAHVTPFFLAVLGVTTALPFIYLTLRCHGFLKTLTKFFRCQKLLILQILTC